MRVTSDTGPWQPCPEWLLDSGITDRAVRLYLVLWTYADRDGTRCFPSRKKLAERVTCSVDSVDRAMGELLSIEAIRVEPRFSGEGDRTSNHYTVFLVRPGGRVGAATGGRVAAAVRPRSSVDRRSSNSSEYDPRFEAFWAEYPRKIEKGKASEAWGARVKSGADPESLTLAAKNYASHVEADGTAPKYVKYPATFLSKNGAWSEWSSPAAVEEKVDPNDPTHWGGLSYDLAEEFEENRRLQAEAKRQAEGS